MNTPNANVPAPNTDLTDDEVGQEQEPEGTETETEQQKAPVPEITPEEEAAGVFEITLSTPITLDKQQVTLLRFTRPNAGHRFAGIKAVGESNLTLLIHAVAAMVGSGEIKGKFRPLTQAAYNELSWIDSVRVEKKFMVLCGF